MEEATISSERSEEESVLEFNRRAIVELDETGVRRLFQRYLSEDVFEVSIAKALNYFLFDYSILLSAFVTYRPLFGLLRLFLGETFGTAAAYTVFCTFYGFVMSCVFVIGHDCVHEVFAGNEQGNELFGRICFTPLLIPYTSFKHKHIEYHQNINKVNAAYEVQGTSLLRWIQDYFYNIPYLRVITGAALSTIEYLYTHRMIPFDNLPSYTGFKTKEYALQRNSILVENVVIAIFLAVVQAIYGKKGIFLYFGCYYVFCWWIYCDNYFSRLQGFKYIRKGKSKEQAVSKPVFFNRDIWRYGKGVLNVYDHNYGRNISKFRHNYSDCAFVHHVLYGEIPHYNLERATKELREKLVLPNETVHHESIFVDFWKVYSGLGNLCKIESLPRKGIIVSAKKRHLKPSAIYTEHEIEEIKATRWRREVKRRRTNGTKALRIDGAWVYPCDFAIKTEEDKARESAQLAILSAASLEALQSKERDTGRKFVPIEKLLDKQNSKIVQEQAVSKD